MKRIDKKEKVQRILNQKHYEQEQLGIRLEQKLQKAEHIKQEK